MYALIYHSFSSSKDDTRAIGDDLTTTTATQISSYNGQLLRRASIIIACVTMRILHKTRLHFILCIENIIIYCHAFGQLFVVTKFTVTLSSSCIVFCMCDLSFRSIKGYDYFTIFSGTDWIFIYILTLGIILRLYLYFCHERILHSTSKWFHIVCNQVFSLRFHRAIVLSSALNHTSSISTEYKI